jgi:hypothetical protein
MNKLDVENKAAANNANIFVKIIIMIERNI